MATTKKAATETNEDKAIIEKLTEDNTKLTDESETLKQRVSDLESELKQKPAMSITKQKLLMAMVGRIDPIHAHAHAQDALKAADQILAVWGIDED